MSPHQPCSTKSKSKPKPALNTKKRDNSSNLTIPTLHSLCSEASGPSDPKWKDIITLLKKSSRLLDRSNPKYEDDEHQHEQEGQTCIISSLRTPIPPYDWTPLHIACLSNPPPFIIDAFLHFSPEAIFYKDTGNRLPLHLACASPSGTSEDVLEILVEANRRGISEPDERGLIPLHMLLRRLPLPAVPDRNGSEGDEEESGIMTVGMVRILLGVQNRERRGRHRNPSQGRQGEMEDLRDWFRKRSRSRSGGSQGSSKKGRSKNHHGDTKKHLSSSVSSSSSTETHQIPPQKVSNPATIPDKNGQLALHMAVHRKHKTFIPKEILISLLSAHPPSISHTDMKGKTPLHLSLLRKEGLPDVDTIKLLIYGHHRHNKNGHTIPSSIPTTDTNELPLHLACSIGYPLPEEILHTILHSYRKAAHTPDAKSRSPLHSLLLSTSRGGGRSFPFYSHRIMRYLVTPPVGRMIDVEGKFPLELLVERTDLSTRMMQCECQFYRNLFCPDFLAESQTKDLQRQRRGLFWKLVANMPEWLRKEAVVTNMVQEAIVRDISESSVMVGLILLRGIILVWLLVAVSLLISHTGENEGIIDGTFWTGYYIGIWFFVLQAMIQVGSWILHSFCFSNTVVVTMVGITNIWTWIDFAFVGISLFVPTVRNHDDDGNDWILLVTFLVCLFLKIIQYLKFWSAGFAVFYGGALVMFHSIGYLFLFLGLLVTFFAQLLLILSKRDQTCMTADTPTNQVCTLGESYQQIYLLFVTGSLGQQTPDTYPENTFKMSMTEILLPLFFFLLLAIGVLNYVVSLISVDKYRKKQCDTLSTHMFWIHRLYFLLDCITFLSFLHPKRWWPGGSTASDSNVVSGPSTSFQERFWIAKKREWEFLSNSLSQSPHMFVERWWYRKNHPFFCCFFGCCSPCTSDALFKLVVQIGAIIILPVWCLMGLGTLGVMWPEQVRMWVFSPQEEYWGVEEENGYGFGERMEQKDLLDDEIGRNKFEVEMMELKDSMNKFLRRNDGG